MNIERFLNQTVQYQPPGVTDPRTGSTTYPPPVTVPARVEVKQNRIRTPTGTETLSDTEVWLDFEPPLSSKINARALRARESMTRVNGEVVGWKAFL